MSKKTRILSAAAAFLLAVSVALAPVSAAGDDWDSFRGAPDNNGVTTADTPQTAEQAELLWAYPLKEAEDWMTNISDPLIIGENIYAIAGSELVCLDRQGNQLGGLTLDASIDSISRAAVQNGIMYIPLSGGAVEAVQLPGMVKLWTTQAVGEAHQSLTTLTCANGKIFVGTAVADWSSSSEGTYRCIDAATGTVDWTYTNNQAGYYWSGAVAENGAVVFAGDDGVLISLNQADGSTLDSLALGVSVRSTVVWADDSVLFTSKDGVLHKVALEKDGSFGAHASVPFGAYSTCTPAVSGGKVYVGGSDAAYNGLFCVINLDAMKLENSFAMPAEVKASPLVSIGDKTTVYFTCNTQPGGVYAYTAGSAPSELFTPEGDHANYCMASVACGADGTLYYTNDSGNLFALGNKAEPPAESAPSEQPGGEFSSAPAPGGTSSIVLSAASSPADADSPATGDSATAVLLSACIGGAVALAVRRKYKG